MKVSFIVTININYYIKIYKKKVMTTTLFNILTLTESSKKSSPFMHLGVDTLGHDRQPLVFYII